VLAPDRIAHVIDQGVGRLILAFQVLSAVGRHGTAGGKGTKDIARRFDIQWLSKSLNNNR